MVSYHNPVVREDRILSVDNIVLDGYIPDPRERERLMVVMDQIHFKCGADVQCWSSYRMGTYHDQYRVLLPDDTSFWVGLGLNQGRTEWGHIRVDANPNKVAGTEAFRYLHSVMRGMTRDESRKIKRYDLAIDIQVSRERCYLVKDNRLYRERRHGKEWTQYLGQTSHVGHVKLYNKQVEAKLPSPLTRLELTLDPKIPYEDIPMPTVYYIDNMQMGIEELKITDTDNFILGALLQGCGSVKQLGRRERAKIERVMERYIKRVGVSKDEYTEIIRQVQSYS